MNINTLYATLLVTPLLGCQSTGPSLTDGEFSAFQQAELPSVMAGNWTGKMGPYLASQHWESDGNGLLCYSFGSTDVTKKMKYSQGEIAIQDGDRLAIQHQSETDLLVSPNHLPELAYLFHKDTQLQDASPYCSKILINASTRGL